MENLALIWVVISEMKIFRVGVDRNPLSGYGSFEMYPEAWDRVKVCEDNCRCGRSVLVRKRNWIVEWYEGKLGDMATNLSANLAGTRLRIDLERNFPELYFETIEVRKPLKSATKLRIEYREIQARRCFLLDPRVGTVAVGCSCEKCGREKFELVGMEKLPHEVKIGDRWEPAPGLPRQVGHGALIPRRLVEGDSFFHLNGFLLCDEKARAFLEAGNYSNISFLEYGELID